MDHRAPASNASPDVTTVVDHLRPTVVVRRRVYDVAALREEAPPKPECHFASLSARTEENDDESPPSSIFAPPPDRIDDLLAFARELNLPTTDDGEDEDEEDDDAALSEVAPDTSEVTGDPPRSDAAVEVSPAAPVSAPRVARPTVVVGPTIAIGKLAAALGMSAGQLAAELVTRGFFDVGPKTMLPRDAARAVADAYGFDVEETDVADEPPAPKPTKPARTKTLRAKNARGGAAASAKSKKKSPRAPKRAA